MARKIIPRSSPGSADTFGADDLSYVNKLLTGEDQSATDPVDINTTWTFRSSKLRIANPANTSYYFIAGSTIGANRTITLPLLTTADTFVVANHEQTLTNKTIDATQNTITNIAAAAGTSWNGETRKAGGWMGSWASSIWGMYSANASTNIIEQAGGGISTITAADGKHTPFTTPSSSAGSDAGWYCNAFQACVSKSVGVRFKCKFKLLQTANTRLFCGLASTTPGNFLGGDTPLNNESGIMVFLSSNGTNFQIAHNDGDSTQNTINLSVADTGIHEIEIKTTTDLQSFQYSLDGVAFTTVSTDIPASTTLLYPYVSIESSSTTGGTKSANFYYWLVECDS